MSLRRDLAANSHAINLIISHGKNRRRARRAGPAARSGRIQRAVVETLELRQLLSVNMVHNTNDSGPGSLRDTIASSAVGDTIEFDAALAGSTITLTSGVLDIPATANLTIIGPSANPITITTPAGLTTGIFQIDSQSLPASFGQLSLSNLDLKGNGTAYIGDGGGILNRGILSISQCTFINLNASRGGAIENNGTLTIQGGVFTSDSAAQVGGAIDNTNTLTINDSNFTSDSASQNGGAIFNAGSSLIVTNSQFNTDSAGTSGGAIYTANPTHIASTTFAGDTAATSGGAIFESGDLTVLDSTFSGDTSASGGGLYSSYGTGIITNSTFANDSATAAAGAGGAIDNNGQITITNSTIAYNKAANGGGLAIGSGFPANIYNTIIADNTLLNGFTASDISGTLDTSVAQPPSTGNLVGPGGSGGLTNGLNDNQVGISSANVNLGMLNSNGGPTQTIALLPGSFAINTGSNAYSLDPAGGPLMTDQRGFFRTVGGTVDIGAYESSSVAPPASLLVNTNSDNLNYMPGTLTLRQAVGFADFADGGGLVTFDPTVFTASSLNPIMLVNGPLEASNLAGTTTVQGLGTGIVQVNGSGLSEIMDVAANAAAALSALTVTNGSNGSASGGGLFNAGTLSVDHLDITDNTALFGGGIYNRGDLTVTNSLISGNTAIFGGGIDNERNMSISNSTVTGNSGYGAGILNNGVGTVTVVTISSNNAGYNAGGGINNNGTLTITGSQFFDNTAEQGGAINTQGSLTLQNSSLSGDITTSIGGGLYNGGYLTILDSTISGETSVGGGGGLYDRGPAIIVGGSFTNDNTTYGGGGAIDAPGTVSVNGTTFSNNSADEGGGAINAEDGSVNIINSTLNNNHATNGSSGGAFENFGDGSVINSTLFGNTADGTGSAIDNSGGGRMNVINSTIVGNTAGVDGAIFSSGINNTSVYNSIVTGNTVTTDNSESDIVGPLDTGLFAGQPASGGNLVDVSNILLAPLGNYGGSTQTMAPLPGSPAIDGGITSLAVDANNMALSTDQRGLPRVQGASVDVGAVETGGYSLSFVTSPTQSTFINTPFANPLEVQVTALNGEDPVAGGQVSFTAAVGNVGTNNGQTAALSSNVATINISADASVTATANGQSGSYTVTAAVGTADAVFTLTNTVPLVATGLAFIQQPTTTTAGSVIAPAVTVAIEDQFGNVLTSDNSFVTLAINTGPAGATLHGTLTVQAVNGVATFSNLSLNTVGAYTLVATDASIQHAISNTFNITAAAADHLAFIQQPTNAIAGSTITPAVSVAVEDVFGNIVAGDTSNVTLAINTGPAGAVLNGTVTVQAISGVATFNNLSINTVGAYTLAATDASLTQALSNSFNITAAAASQLVYVQQPSNTIAGNVIAPAVQLAVEDQFGNIVTSDNSNVTVAIYTGPAGAVLNGTLTVTALNGVATFSNLSINTVGTYMLIATDGALNNAISNSFNITAAAPNHLAFIQQPTNTVAGSTITPAVTVAVEDAFGNIVSGDSSNVTIAINTGPAGAVLNGTLTVAAVNGVATFSTLSLNTTGTYTLKATDASLTNAISNSFTVSASTADHLAFLQQPTNTTAGSIITPAVTVAVEDVFGNIVTTDGSNVTLAINTGPAGAILNGTLTVAAINGVATFNTLSINTVGAYTLAATDATLTQAISASFNITPATANHLAFVQQPTNTTAGSVITPSVAVAVEDQFGNIVTTDNSNVTIAINTGPAGAVLNGTLTVAAINGVATFSTLSINTVGTYTLAATDSALTQAISASFNITAATANHLAFVQQPTDTVAGNAITPDVTVAVEDQFGNVVTTDSSNVTIAINTGPAGAVLNGTLTVAAVNGIATFHGLTIDQTGTYTLAATDTGLNQAISAPFHITPAPADHLAFIQQPTNAIAGNIITPAVTVAVEDQFGNIVTTDGSNVTIAVNTGPGALNGTLTVAAVNGVATFSNLSLNVTGVYTLRATDSSLVNAISNSFTITAAAADHLAFIQQPGTTPSGIAINPAPTVAVEDRFNNIVTTDSSTVTVSINSGPAGAVLSGTLSEPAVNGVATFANLALTPAGIYTLLATDPAATQTVSNSFIITQNNTAQPQIDLSVTKSVNNSTPNVGTNVIYTVTVSNATGTNEVTATNVSVSDMLPAGETLVSATPSIGTYSAGIWSIPTLATGATATLTYTTKVTAFAPQTNTATVTGSDQNDVGTQLSASVTINPQEIDLSVIKTVNNSTPNVGTNVTYTVTVANGGGYSTATNISLSDMLPAGETLVSATPSVGTYSGGIWSIPTLAAGASATLKDVVTVNTFAPQTNTATITAADQTDIGSPLSASVTINPQEVKLSVAKTVNNSTPNVGSNVTYTITVTNAGGFSTATNISLSDMLPAGETLVSATPSVGTYSGGVWSIPSLAAGTSATLSDIVTVNAYAAQTNTATITGVNQTDIGSPLSASVTINPQEVKLSVTKTVNNTAPNVGSNVTYTVTVTNASGFNTATNISLSDMLPAGETLVSATPSVGTYTAGVWSIPTLAAGASATLTDVVTVKTFAPQTNTATITGANQTDIGSPLSASVTINPQEVDLSVTKTVNNSTPNVGSNVTYTVTVANASGFSTATHVSLSDLLPAGETLVSATPSVGTYSGGVWSIPTLAAGASATLTDIVTVNTYAPQTNTATITAADQTDIGSPLTASVTINPQEIKLAVTKTVNSSTPNVGTNVIYTVTVSNASGFSAATNVSLKDLLPSGESLVSATPSQGTYASANGIWTIGTLAAGGSATLTYTAKVNVFAAQTNTATITAADQTDIGTPLSASVTINPQEVDLSVTKTVNNSTPNVGANVVYTVTVHNAVGYSTATNVSLKDLLPSSEILVSATPSQGTYASGTGVWTIGSLAANGTATLTVTATVTAAAAPSVTNTATITAADQTDIGSPLSASVTVYVQGNVDLSVLKTESTPQICKGNNVTYTVTVSNAAGFTNATGVVLTDILPTGLSFVTATPSQGSYNTYTGVWSVGTVNSGASATLTVVAKTTCYGVFINTASICSSNQVDVGTQLSSTVTLVVGAALDGQVWNDLNGNGLIDAGEPGISNVTVELVNTYGNVVVSTTTDGSGDYSFLGVAPGSYQVEFLAPSGYTFTTANVGNNPAINSSAVAGNNNNNNNGYNGCGEGQGSNNGCDNYSYSYCGHSYSGCYSDSGYCGSGFSYNNCGGGSYSYEYSDSNNNCHNNNYCNNNNIGVACVTLVCGTTTGNVNAGMFLPGSIGNYVWFDQNGNGIQDSSESGVNNVLVKLLSSNGTTVLQTTTTNYAGHYSFTNLAPGQYVVQFVAPCGDMFTAEGVGSNPAVNSSANPATGKTSVITLASGQTDNNVDAGVFQSAQLSGMVFVDYANNGCYNNNDAPLSGITIELLSGSGQIVQTTTTDCYGSYNFNNIAPGTYSLFEPQSQAALNGYLIGKDSVGTVNGATDGTVSTIGMINNIVLGSGADGINYNFGESAPGQTLTTGDTGSLAFWCSQAGQNLICALNGANSNSLGNWLAGNFANIYGKSCGSANLTNKTNTQVCQYFLNVCANNNQQTNAQVMACALNLYVTNSSLCGTIAANYGFTVSSTGCGVLEFNTWIYGAVCGGSNDCLKSVLQIFQNCNVKAVNGQLYGGSSSLQSQADSVFTAINQAGDIGAD